MAKKVTVSEMPTGVKVISVFYYIGAGFTALLGLLSLLGAGFIASLLKSTPMLGAVGSGLFILFGVIFIAVGVLEFFVGRGLWKGQNWARIVAIIFSSLGIFGGLLSLLRPAVPRVVGPVIGLAINVVIVWYLGFSQKSKSAFA